MKSSWSFVIVAGGKGLRLGGTPKQLRLLGGSPLWTWSARCAQVLFDAGEIAELVLVVPSGQEELFDRSFLTMPLRCVAGGTTRTDSVRSGLSAASGAFVLVHDGARPFLSPGLCRRLMAATTERHGAIPLCPVNDALKIQTKSGPVSLDRGTVRATQTPQAFPRRPLLNVLGEGATFLDEAEAWLESGGGLSTVEGDRMNFKITDEADWKIARALAAKPVTVRTGHGFDVHPLVPGRALFLGGVRVEAPLGLDGHSDADIVCHAVSDALLGAAGLPDLGTLFPASEERYRDADSYELLRQVLLRVVAEGWDILWVDVTLHAQIPRLGSCLASVRDRMGELFDREEEPRFNIKVKSGEKVGSVGSGASMECHALATIRRGG
ncbi:2-C-methyl-D-erythritol 2,4-cyclodiphosphate synthase [Aminithiophilus ramosus]|uniref:2-C-methyl-D-erythritol 2,4-cyclodiphosphate synthase n=2 Tax=Synergistales TaxID=649776 RepID=A0A9Q7ETQ7_9BACT|nr:2-C-methyl-D-erythritol 2,4-cyclodiphosphate synthase [Aminithiophilus ramosus]QTX31208.1 2-C-methyl-D-erythritol 2,4-cyclodiphosphate synthase [Aminithiophilus ramosus]QVL37486.1 2-C-methyl-D-erythritol 2,4-cyclodiphosphate synthase [Synergistota bacterium]